MKKLTVTIIVLSYNAENTIKDTLDSIYNQTYKSIRLIISDDHSMDNTVITAKSWAEKNNDRFEEIIFRENPKNLGTSKHLNNIIRELESNTEWVKIIGADDILMENCILDNMEFVEQYAVHTVVFSKMRAFQVGNKKKIYREPNYEEIALAKKISVLNAKEQYQKLLKRDMLSSPTIFINRNCYLKAAGCDERIRNIEDWPLKLNITRSNQKIYVMDKYTVWYRIGDSVSHSTQFFLRKDFIDEFLKMKNLLCYPNIKKYHILYYYEEMLERIRYFIIINILRNKKNTFTKCVNYITYIPSIKKWRRFFVNKILSRNYKLKDKEGSNCR